MSRHGGGGGGVDGEGRIGGGSAEDGSVDGARSERGGYRGDGGVVQRSRFLATSSRIRTDFTVGHKLHTERFATSINNLDRFYSWTQAPEREVCYRLVVTNLCYR